MNKTFNWDLNFDYSSKFLSGDSYTETPELGVVPEARYRDDKVDIEFANLSNERLDRNETKRKQQVGANAAMSALGLLTSYGIAKRAKQANEITYQNNLIDIELSNESAERKIGLNSLTSKKNIYASLNQQKANINSNLLKDPRVLSTSSMSELQGSEGRITQGANISVAKNKLETATAKSDLNLRTTIARGEQEIEKYRQEEAIEAQKTAAIQKGVTDVAMMAVML